MSSRSVENKPSDITTSNLPALRGYNEEVRFAIGLARESGKMIRRGFGLKTEFELKDDKSRVTRTDIEVNKFVIESIRRRYPAHDIVGEEISDRRKSAFIWVNDPIDGTLPFSVGVPTCCFSLALVRDGNPVVGVVYDPFMDRMFHAEKDGGAFLNDQRIHVSRARDLKETVIALSYFESAKIDLTPLHQIFRKMDAKILDYGSIIYGSMLVASGRYSAAVNPTEFSHDVAASKVIVEEAGGRVTDLFGREQPYDGKICGCIVSNGNVHKEVESAIQQLVRV